MHQPRPHIWLECQWEVVGKNLLISSPGILNTDGVDAQEVCRVQPSIILLGYLWLERTSGWPTDLPQLVGKGRAPNLERRAPAILERGLIDIGTIAPIGPTVVIAMSLDDDARVSPVLVLWCSPLA